MWVAPSMALEGIKPVCFLLSCLTGELIPVLLGQLLPGCIPSLLSEPSFPGLPREDEDHWLSGNPPGPGQAVRRLDGAAPGISTSPM